MSGIGKANVYSGKCAIKLSRSSSSNDCVEIEIVVGVDWRSVVVVVVVVVVMGDRVTPKTRSTLHLSAILSTNPNLL